MKLIQFNYDTWKEHPDWKVFTRAGREPKALRDMREFGTSGYWELSGVVSGSVVGWSIDGKFMPGDNESTLDLFLVPPEPKRVTGTGYIYDTDELSSVLWKPGEFPNPSDTPRQPFDLVLEKREDGTWIVIGTEQLSAEKAVSNG